MNSFRKQRPYLILLLLFALSGMLLAFTVDVSLTDQAGVRDILPAKLPGDWKGLELRFCQNPRCTRSWFLKDLEAMQEAGTAEPGLCPVTLRGEPCGSELSVKAYGEAMALPEDTDIVKMIYRNESKLTPRQVLVSMVLSGRDRSSIHRPEVCMPSQGNTIVSTEILDVPLAGREPLQLMVLNLSREDAQRKQMEHSYFAYWFVGVDRETPHHHERMLWMGLDRLIRNVSHRWAYIIVSGSRDAEDSSLHHDEIREVVQGLYPVIRIEPEEL